MTLILPFVVTLAVLVALDAAMLGLFMAPLFMAHIGPIMAEPMRAAPAVLFYPAYAAGLVWLVSRPALREGRAVVAPAAVVGAMAYGTFELTNYAILRDWHLSMVVADMAWGTVLTAVSAWAGVTAVRRWG